MNSMADNIGGITLHSFGKIAFKDRRGVLINTGRISEKDSKGLFPETWNNLRFLLIDEIEAAGVEIIGQIESKIRTNVPVSSTVHQAMQHTQHPDRERGQPFAGVNVLFFGDFWQLDPTGATSFMSNPCKTDGNPYADLTLSMFWHGPDENATESSFSNFHLQPWTEKARVLELNQNLRSGEDEWFSSVLDECRLGALQEENYNFLHGLPTNAEIVFWFHRLKDSTGWKHNSEHCSRERRCPDCLQEARRRNRLLDMGGASTQAAEILADAKFKTCMLITTYNQAVFQFAIHRAQNFAAATEQQLFWMQAIDNPPSWFAGTMTQKELQKTKQMWLQFHARKTEGVLSICPLCYGMPLKITNGNGYLSRLYGIRNGATCVLQG